jgi:nucleoside-diphosphate-sugar epimerase
MRILLLGSSGFIGKALGHYLDQIYQVTKINRKSDLLRIFDANSTFDYVINCASSRVNSNSEESFESNFKYPERILRTTDSKHWIQIESYSQLQIGMGRQDSYVLDKQRFSEYLDAYSKSSQETAVHHLYLPHVFGQGDRRERLISSAIYAIKNRKIFETSLGTQFLPLLHITDAVSGIAKYIENPNQKAACTPFWYGKVKELLEMLSTHFESFKPVYGSRPDPVDANFPRVQFPKRVQDWKPEMQIEEFIVWIKRQCD